MKQKPNKKAFERKVKKSENGVADYIEKIPGTTGTVLYINSHEPSEKETRDSTEQLRIQRR